MCEKNIKKWGEKKGYCIRIGSTDCLKSARKKIQQKKTAKEIDPDLFKEYLNFLDCSEEFEIDDSNSLIMVAVPRPAHVMLFEKGTEIIKMVLPPTYVNYCGLFEKVLLELESEVFSGKATVKTLQALLKTLAYEMGLVSYGKNNLTYIPEFGSFFQWLGYIVDTPLVETKSTEGGEGGMMPKCANCNACNVACPLGAIDKDRFLIHAERCYTLYSESIRPIPEEIHPPSTNCIIGCLRCQEVCPMNKGRLKYEDSGVFFSSQETLAILDSDKMNPGLMQSIEAKFAGLSLSENADLFIRNFRKIFKDLKRMVL